MRDYKKCGNKELAAKMVEYIERTKRIIDLYNTESLLNHDEIKDQYALLKKELQEDYKYLYPDKNRQGISDLYERYFQPSIIEAIVEGFIVKIGANVNENLFHSLVDGRYKLTKYICYEKWQRVKETGILPDGDL